MNDDRNDTANGHEPTGPDLYPTTPETRAALHELRSRLRSALDATGQALRDGVTLDTLGSLQNIRSAERKLADAMMPGRAAPGPDEPETDEPETDDTRPDEPEPEA